LKEISTIEMQQLDFVSLYQEIELLRVLKEDMHPCFP
jgi:hypothetical protein